MRKFLMKEPKQFLNVPHQFSRMKRSFVILTTAFCTGLRIEGHIQTSILLRYLSFKPVGVFSFLKFACLKKEKKN